MPELHSSIDVGKWLARKMPLSGVRSGAGHAWDMPPRWLWICPLAVAALRMIPFVWAICLSPPSGQMVLKASYMPPDVLSYHAFIRQSAECFSVLLANPYTLDAQQPRYILLLHSVLGSVSHVTGLSAAWVWEFSRFPLACVLLMTMWWFLRPILPDRRDRVWACLLVSFSGGIEGLIKLGVDWLPSFFADSFSQATWHLYGWNTFEVMANPMWICGIILLLIVLKPLLKPGGMRGLRDQVQVGVGAFVVFYVHPYSGLVVFAIAATLLATDLVFRRPLDLSRHAPMMRSLIIPFVLIALVSTWQSGDAVYRETAGNVFGTLQLSIFWYPITLGVVGMMALRGAQHWARQSHPYRFSLLAWVVAITWMHTSPLLNGYHFVMFLHLPICIVAAPVLRRLLETSRGRTDRRWSTSAVFTTCALLALTFLSCGLVTMESIADIRRNNFRPAEYQQIISHMQDVPAGRVLCDDELGAILPAYTGHRVYVGHWFLSPDFLEKRRQYEQVTSDSRHAAALDAMITQQEANYVFVPRGQSSWVADCLAGRFSARVTFRSHTLFVLRSREAS